MMRTAKSGTATGAIVLAATLLLAATQGRAMPLAPAPETPHHAIVKTQFLGGPFFGRYGYYEADRAKRHYFYEGFDPSVYPPEAKVRRHHRLRRRYTYR